jgi:hypothetical protein
MLWEGDGRVWGMGEMGFWRWAFGVRRFALGDNVSAAVEIVGSVVGKLEIQQVV